MCVCVCVCERERERERERIMLIHQCVCMRVKYIGQNEKTDGEMYSLNVYNIA